MTELGWQGHAAQSHILLGHAALRGARPDLRSARAHLSAALPWTVMSAEVETLLRCLELEAELALAERRPELASELVARGRRTAESCGFGLFVTRFAGLGAGMGILDIRGPGRSVERESSESGAAHRSLLIPASPLPLSAEVDQRARPATPTLEASGG
jgi:hypothetical protein